MAAPMKRLCSQAARHSTRRTFTNTAPHHRADHVSQPRDRDSSNPFLTQFPKGEGKDTTPSHLDPQYESDDLSTLALSELDNHRELRSLIRTAAWEMPLLSALHKPFEPPKMKHTSPLRWRYTTYMGEQHPAASKVVVTFDPKDLPGMDDRQRDILTKLAGTRYDHGKGRVKMSCESFETQAQNKRYLGDIIQTLIAEAKDPTADSFEDIPLDTRHAKRRVKLKFPSAWRLTEERKSELDAARHKELLEEGRKVEEGALVSGDRVIEAMEEINLQQVEEPVMAEVRRELPRGKMGRKEMGQTRGANR
ncbi:37S ribosomal protein S24, mitochondrial [Elasticomyces elasticus]|nr:37S ribosomal protein S24, mitochondrial [Elasticomyces elasticus]